MNTTTYWYREVVIDESIGRNLLNEARGLHMIGESVADGHSLSAALPSRSAAREYAKAEPEVREVIKEIIKEDPEAEIKAAEIRKLRAERDELIRRVGAAIVPASTVKEG